MWIVEQWFDIIYKSLCKSVLIFFFLIVCLLFRSGLNKRQTQLVYSYILMWVLPEISKKDNLVKGNSVQQCLPNQLVGRYK